MVSNLTNNNNIKMLEKIKQADFFTEENIDTFILMAVDNNRAEIVAMLSNYKVEKFGFTDIDKEYKL